MRLHALASQKGWKDTFDFRDWVEFKQDKNYSSRMSCLSQNHCPHSPSVKESHTENSIISAPWPEGMQCGNPTMVENLLFHVIFHSLTPTHTVSGDCIYMKHQKIRCFNSLWRRSDTVMAVLAPKRAVGNVISIQPWRKLQVSLKELMWSADNRGKRAIVRVFKPALCFVLGWIRLSIYNWYK